MRRSASSHWSSFLEFLRSQQSIQQVSHQTCAYDQHDDRFSIHSDSSSANSIAELHVTDRQHEKRDRDYHKDQVLHTTSSKVRTNFAPGKPGTGLISHFGSATLPAALHSIPIPASAPEGRTACSEDNSSQQFETRDLPNIVD